MSEAENDLTFYGAVETGDCEFCLLPTEDCECEEHELGEAW